jgi:DNA polymerase III epsilon subunit family exonuclease
MSGSDDLIDWDRHYWTDFPVLIFDTETSGLSKQDRICEISIVVAKGLRVIRRFDAFINPGVPIEESAAEVHGITDEQVRDAPTWDAVADQILPLFQLDVPWISHNLAFDLRFLSYEWPKSEWPRGIPTLCTHQYSKKHPTTRMRGAHKLPALANHFHIDYDPYKLHGATYDTNVLHGVVNRMMAKRTIGGSFSKYNHEWLSKKR